MTAFSFLPCVLPTTISLQACIFLEGAKEATSRCVMAAASTWLINLLENLFGKDLAKLNTPLIERVDVPDGALRKGEMLVVDDQRTQFRRADIAADQDTCSWAVAEEDLMWHQVLGGALSLDFLGRLSDHQGLGLSKVVGGQHLLVHVVGDRVVRLGSQDEVGWDQLGALVDQLEEGVLGIGTRLAEQDRAGCVFGGRAIGGNALAVRLHGQLLEVGREPVEVLVKAIHKTLAREQHEHLFRV